MGVFLEKCIVKRNKNLLFQQSFKNDRIILQGEPLTKNAKGYIIMKKRSWIDQLIYSTTQKPKHCVKVKNPPKTVLEKLRRPQDARQEQYNRWSKRFKVYSGSYLPPNPDDLLEKGWRKKKISEEKHSYFQRNSTNQTVRYDKDRINSRGEYEKAHYHWYIWWKKFFGKKSEAHLRKKQRKKNKKEKVYYNEYGEETCLANKDHHIYP